MMWATPAVGRPLRPRSDQPTAVAHQLAVGQLVHLSPGLDATRRDAEPAIGGQCARIEAGPLYEPVAALRRKRVDLEDLDLAVDDRDVAGESEPQPSASGG